MKSTPRLYVVLTMLFAIYLIDAQQLLAQFLECPDDVPYSYVEPGIKSHSTRCTVDAGSVATLKVDKNANFCVTDDLFKYWSELPEPDGNPYLRCTANYDLGEAFFIATNAVVNQLNSIAGCGFNFSVTRKTDVEWCNPDQNINIEAVSSRSWWERNVQNPDRTPGVALGNCYNESGHTIRPAIAINTTIEISSYGCYSNQPCSNAEIEAETPDGKDTVICFDIQTILLHEILHVLGLGHISGSKCGGTDSSGNPCLTEEQYQQFSATQNLSQDPMYCNLYYNYMARNLSCYNICALKKLYCPAGSPSLSGYPRVLTETCVLPTSVHPTAATPDRPTLEVIPTQTRNSIRIQIGNWHGKLGVSIFTSAGTLMDNLEMSSETMSIDVSRYPSGSYFVRVGVNNVLLSATFVVVR